MTIPLSYFEMVLTFRYPPNHFTNNDMMNLTIYHILVDVKIVRCTSVLSDDFGLYHLEGVAMSKKCVDCGIGLTKYDQGYLCPDCQKDRIVNGRKLGQLHVTPVDTLILLTLAISGSRFALTGVPGACRE